MLKIVLPSLLLLFSLPLLANSELKNQVNNHPSPYLALNGNDPVAWQDWGPDVMERAKSEGKLVFISSGYFACHWCHVMQRESYQNPVIANLLNQHFIPVKVDRELLPALDAHLIEFVQRTRGHAGWPLNVFLTPEGYPLVGLTYAPPQSFLELLNRVQLTWDEKQTPLSEMARQAAAEIATGKQPVVGERVLIDSRLLHAGLVTMALAMGNEMEGGFGNGSRFPMAPQWLTLLARHEQEPDENLAELLRVTLDQMASQGMRDHLGGGFFRYTVDPGWQVPHYEKMLYNQALLSQLYTKAAQVLKQPDYLQVVRDTLDFTLEILAGSEGGYIASLSAVDQQDVEGGGYLWRDDQLQQLLTDEELQFAVSRWRLEGSAETDGGYLPIDHQASSVLAVVLSKSVENIEKLEHTVRNKLLDGREERAHPRDTKQLAAWNGLLLSALVDASEVLDEPRYRQAANGLRSFLVKQLWDGKQLLRARSSTGPLGHASLEDYAYVAKGLDSWNQMSDNSEKDESLVAQLIKTAWKRFYRDGGWVKSDDQLIPGMMPEQAMADGPMPSPSAVLIDLTLRQGSETEQALARLALRQSYAEVRENPIAHATTAGLLINLNQN